MLPSAYKQICGVEAFSKLSWYETTSMCSKSDMVRFFHVPKKGVRSTQHPQPEVSSKAHFATSSQSNCIKVPWPWAAFVTQLCFCGRKCWVQVLTWAVLTSPHVMDISPLTCCLFWHLGRVFSLGRPPQRTKLKCLWAQFMSFLLVTSLFCLD